MKTAKILTTFSVLFLFVGFLACNDNEEECNCPFSVSEFSHSECKNPTKGAAEAEYMKLKAEGKYIIVKHMNVVFNCCPKEITVTSAIDNYTIVINEREKEQGCKCICPYDLKYKLGKLKHGKYRIILKKNNNPVTKFDIVFNDELDATVSINP